MNKLKYKLIHSLDIIVATILTSALSIAVIKFNIFATIDGDIHLTWGYYWNQQILEGQLYPKWFEQAFGGLGTTSFIFYPPLMRLISFPLGVLHFSPAQQIKGTLLVILFINAWGVFKLSRILLLRNSIYSLVSISLGIVNPFLMSELFKRGGFPSICFIALIPWLGIGIFNYINNLKVKNLIFLTLVFAAIFLSHIPSCLILITAYFCAIFILVLFKHLSLKNAFLKLIMPVFLAILIDAFFLLPIFFDVHLVHQAFVPSIDTIKNRLFFMGIFELQPILMPKGVESNFLKIFWFDTIILLLTFLFFKPGKCKSAKNILLRLHIFMVTFSLLMITAFAYPIYAHISTFRKLQFPWRYFALSTSLIPYFSGYTLEKLGFKFSFLKKRNILTAIAIVVLLLNYKSAEFILRSETASTQFIDRIMMQKHTQITSRDIDGVEIKKLENSYSYLDLNKKGAPLFFLDNDRQFFQGDVYDYIPHTVSVKNEWLYLGSSNNNKQKILLPKQYSSIEIVQGQGNFSIVKWGQEKRYFKFQSTTGAILNLKTYYYPGWKIEVTPTLTVENQKQLISVARDGRIQLKLPAGFYSIKIYYQGTIAEQIGLLITFCTVLILGGVLLFKVKTKSSSKNSQ